MHIYENALKQHINALNIKLYFQQSGEASILHANCNVFPELHKKCVILEQHIEVPRKGKSLSTLTHISYFHVYKWCPKL